jgi:divalent metal cation (Fe/Co/Zn/Cd) transporter
MDAETPWRDAPPAPAGGVQRAATNPVSSQSPQAAGDLRLDPRLRAAVAGVRVELVTVAWMAAEALIAIAAGVLARSVLLVAFGLDSVIELLSGAVLLWRLRIEAGGGRLERVQRAERHAAWVVALSLVLLCVYIVLSAVWGLLRGVRPDVSPAGIVLAVAAVVVMPLLARAKRRVAAAIQSPALHGDAACSMTCAAMAGALLAGLAGNAVLRWWQVEYVAVLAFLYWLVPEAQESLTAARRGLLCCCDGDRHGDEGPPGSVRARG